ncbi:conjugal transfer protein TraL (plasmid) [Shewanella sp. SNU WT4]|uniref:nucleotide-binding protein n=1 Tax=Shewanella sp. SNU WT4 TaxID=2590015 RepID=UPI00112C777F|nr:conjugal transfer protein TraL [Shewanella sp. SNU WT4]QDF68699.1 conjugal transfer protein TraL [Shewanella sp. SNU WT4]
MSKIHFILQGKGGVGKSLIASLIAQFCIEHGKTPHCIDTDPVNQSFTAYGALNVHQLDILVNHDVDQSKFDQLIELIGEHPEQDFVIDNGASCFVPLSHYLLSNGTIQMLMDMGHDVIIHTVVTGGQSLADTIHGLDNLAEKYPTDCQLVVWLNTYWGLIERDGKSFEQLKVYQNHKERINGIITIEPMQKDTFQRDFINMLSAKQTFAEAVINPKLSIMNRQRLTMIRRKLFEQMAATNCL